jgi:hypothetical protein
MAEVAQLAVAPSGCDWGACFDGISLRLMMIGCTLRELSKATGMISSLC